MVKGWLILFLIFVVAFTACMAIISIDGIRTGETRWPELAVISLLVIVGVWLAASSRK